MKCYFWSFDLLLVTDGINPLKVRQIKKIISFRTCFGVFIKSESWYLFSFLCIYVGDQLSKSKSHWNAYIIANNTNTTRKTTIRRHFPGVVNLLNIWINYVLPSQMRTLCNQIRRILFTSTKLAQMGLDSSRTLTRSLLQTETLYKLCKNFVLKYSHKYERRKNKEKNFIKIIANKYYAIKLLSICKRVFLNLKLNSTVCIASIKSLLTGSTCLSH